MKLSLSVRVGESYREKRVFAAALPEFVRIVKDSGFDAVCMRASVVGTHSTADQVAGVRDLLNGIGLHVSMVTGNFAIPANQAEGPECLRNITPHLDLAEMLGSDLIRICMKETADVAPARAAADEAAERDIRLAHQTHHTSLFETVEGSLGTVRSVGRPNFGIIYEPANLAMCGEDYGRRAIEALAPHMFNVYVQNQVPDSAGDLKMNTWARGRVMTRLRPLDEPGGIEFEEIFEALLAVGYDGYITSHQAVASTEDVEDVTRRYASFLREFIKA